MLLGIILSFVASGAIGTLWYSKSVFGSIWLRHHYGDRQDFPECPKGAAMFTAMGSAGTMILLANLFSAELLSASLMTAAVNGLKLALLVCLTQISHAVFSRTPPEIYLIDCGYDVTIICAAAIIMYCV